MTRDTARTFTTRCGTLLFGVLFLGCSRTPNESVDTRRAHLGPGIVAQVGKQSIAAGTVLRIARAQHVSAQKAREYALFDALCAEEARAEYAGSAWLEVAQRAEGARAMLEELLTEATQKGAPSDAEVEDLTRERWQELDRPETVRTTHAVVLNDKPEKAAAARALAERLREALEGSKDSEQFIERAKNFPHGDFEIRAEHLPSMTRNGRAYYPGTPGGSGPPGSTQNFDTDFAIAAHALKAPQEISGIVKTGYGFHILWLDERIAEKRIPLEERRSMLEKEILSRRAEQKRKALVTELRAQVRIEISTSSQELTELARPQF